MGVTQVCNRSFFERLLAVVRWRLILRVGLALLLVSVLGGSQPAQAAPGRGPGDHPKLDRKLNDRDRNSKGGTSRAIIELKPGWDVSAEVSKLGGKIGRRLRLMDGLAVEVPNKVLRKLADNPAVARIIWDRPLDSTMNRVSVTVGARAVQEGLGLTGAGIGVAVIDSGITGWHDDLTYRGSSPLVRVKNGQRVAAFVDFVGGRTAPYDDYGHGTHVAGIIAGNGYDTGGSRAGIAPDAHLVGLRVLDGSGRGVISNVIAALEWAVTNRGAYNIRVINLSVGAGITESYTTDPLALAAKRAVDAGIVVVAAAGNLGKDSLGRTQYGGITAPGNAPWVLTVGASSTEGTITRADDVYAPYSSRGPSAIDYQAKPDLLAPGTGVVSLSDPTSLLYLTKTAFLLKGLLPFGSKPYLSLSGTSMASPVVAGTVALMLQANPALTPNLVKAVLQYTSQPYPGYNALTQGAGFLNAKGAVDLARFFRTAQAGQRYPFGRGWSRNLIWGGHRLTGGVIKPNGTAWKIGVVWGAPRDVNGQNIVWGTMASSEDNIVWGTQDSEDNIVWGTASEDNIVWGTYASSEDNIVWGTMASSEDNIVWGTDCAGADCEGVVWGASASEDNIVWGTASSEDNIVWGTSGEIGNVTWATSGEDTSLFENPASDPVSYDSSVFEDLFEPTLEPVLEPVVNTLTGAIGGLF
jgi:serine protease AprX